MVSERQLAGAIPFLVGDRIYLRPLQESDLNDQYLRWLNDQDVTKYLEAGRFPVTPDDLRQYFERFAHGKDDLIFAIIDKVTEFHIGNVTLNHIQWVHRTADTGLMIGRKEFWGLGYAREAWTLVIDYAFRRLGLRKVIAGAIAENAASIRTLQKLGFRAEGVLRKELLADGEYRDVLRFGLFAGEFHAAGEHRAVLPQTD